MDKRFFEKRCKYSIRKFTIGAASVMIGATFLGAQAVSAEEMSNSEQPTTEHQTDEQGERAEKEVAASTTPVLADAGVAEHGDREENDHNEAGEEEAERPNLAIKEDAAQEVSLAKVQNAHAERLDASAVLVSYDAVEGATHYEIERREGNKDDAATKKIFSVQGTSYLDQTVEASKQYQYLVKAKRFGQEGAASDISLVKDLPYTIDDRDPRIKYGASYHNYGNNGFARGTEKYADITGSEANEEKDTATLNFKGVGVEIYGAKSYALGKAAVTIDGVDKGEIDFYSLQSQQRTLIGRFDGLTDGEHVLKLRVKKGYDRRQSELYKVSLDYFKILQGKTETVEQIDDRDPRVVYGSEFHDWPSNGMFEGTEKYADINSNPQEKAANATATLQFYGTGVRVFGNKSSWLGSALVTVDGHDKEKLNFYKNSTSTDQGVLIGEIKGLTNDYHTLVLKVDPTPSQGGKKISLDYFEIIKEPSTQIHAPELANVAKDENQVKVTLPSGEWDKVQLRFVGDQLLDITKDTPVENGVATVTIPDTVDRTADSLVEAVTLRGEEQASDAVVALLAKKDPEVEVPPVTPAPEDPKVAEEPGKPVEDKQTDRPSEAEPKDDTQANPTETPSPSEDEKKQDEPVAPATPEQPSDNGTQPSENNPTPTVESETPGNTGEQADKPKTETPAQPSAGDTDQGTSDQSQPADPSAESPKSEEPGQPATPGTTEDQPKSETPAQPSAGDTDQGTSEPSHPTAPSSESPKSEEPGQPVTPTPETEVHDSNKAEDREITLENSHLKRTFKIEDGKLHTESITNKLSDKTLMFGKDSKEFTIQFKKVDDVVEEVPDLPQIKSENTDQASWTITTTSQQSQIGAEGPVKFAFDGNPSTIWHSRYSSGEGTSQHLPVSVTLAFPTTKDISTLLYTPRQNGDNGDIKEYKISVKKDGGDFVEVSHGSLEAFSDKSVKFISFDKQTDVKELKLEILSSQNGQPFASAAEFDVSSKTVATLKEEYVQRVAAYKEEIATLLSKRSLSMDQLLVAKDGVVEETTKDGKRVTVTFQPYVYNDVPVSIKYVTELKTDASYSQSHLEISVPEEDATKVTIETIDLQSYQLTGEDKVEDFSKQANIAEMSGFNGFYAGLGQPVYVGSFYTGSEFPVALNTVQDRQLLSRYYSGKNFAQLSKDEHGVYHTWNTVMGVARSDDYQVLQQDFYQYLNEIGQKTYYRKQYNSWFDHMKNITAENIKESFDQVDRGFTRGGVSPLDSYVVDDGWQNVRSLWEFNQKFPNKLYDSSRQTGRFGSHFGLWLGPQGGYGNPGEMADALVQANKGSKHAGVVYIGDKRYVDGLRDRFKEYDQKFGINYWKLDGLLLNPRAKTDEHGIGGGPLNMYSMTETHERWIDLYKTIRENATDPDKMWINLTSYIPPSPWFLQWVNSIWMQNSGDVDYQDGVKKEQYRQLDFGSDANEALTYRDDRYEELVKLRKWQLPFANIYNHDPVYGNTANSGKRIEPNGNYRPKINFTTDELRTYLYMLGTRGTGFWEFYYSPSMMDDDKWQVNGEAVNWIENNYETLKHARFHGGKPGHGEVYGYSAWDKDKGIVSVRNPINKEQSYTLKLDRLVGLPENISNLYRKVVLGDNRHNTTETTKYGDSITLTLKPYETVIFEYSKTDDIKAAELQDARVTSAKTIHLTFDEKVNVADAHFTVAGKTVESQALNADLRTVTLTLKEELKDKEIVKVHYTDVKDGSAHENLSKGDITVTAYDRGRILEVTDAEKGQTLQEGFAGKGAFSVTVKATLKELNQTLAQQGDEWKLSVDANGRVTFAVKDLTVKSAPYTTLKEDDKGKADELLQADKEFVVTAMRQANGSLRLYINGQLHNTAYDKSKVNENLMMGDVTLGSTDFKGEISHFILENQALDFKEANDRRLEVQPQPETRVAPVKSVTASSYDENDGGPRTANDAIDDAKETYWASSPTKDNRTEKQTITLELENSTKISGVIYTPRQVPNAVGNVKRLYLEVSPDGQNWNRATIVDAEADNTKVIDASDIKDQTIAIEPVQTKFVRLTALHTAHWNPNEEDKIVAVAGLKATYEYVPEKLKPTSETTPTTENHIIDVSTFGADSTGQKDSTKAVQDAIEAAKKLKGNVTIVFPKGEYQFYPDKAVSKEYYISNTVGADQQYKDKKIGMLLKDMENVTIDGSDSTFIFHGKMTTFATDHSKNITFKNFSVDFKVPTVVDLYTESVSGNTVTYQVPDEFPYEIDGTHINWKSDVSPYTNQPYWTGRDKFNYTQIHDTKTGLTFRASNPIFDNVSKIEDLGNRRLKFTYTSRNDSIKEGYSYQMRPTVRDHAGTFFIDSENVTLNHLNIHFLHGFGMVYQTSKDFTVNDVHFATPKDSKRTTAGYADFIQVSGSKGHVLIQNSSFENPHDDPINVHGTFLEVVEKIANNKVKVRYKHNETAGFPSFFVGDQVEFLTKGNMIAVPHSVRTVTAVDGPSGRDHEKNLTDITLTFDQDLPGTVTAGSHVAENISYTPSVTIKNNTFKSVPTRGILVTTRKPVLIENNTFDGMGMASIYISSDAQGWYESSGVKDVTIRNNTFYGRSNAPLIYIEPTNPTVSTENTVHEHIKVENNHFYVGNTAVLDAKSVKDLQFKHNTIDRYESNVSVDLSSPKIKLNLAETSQLSADVKGLKRTAPLYRFNGVKEVLLENNTYAGGLNVSMRTQHQATSDVTVKEKTEVPAGTDHVLDVSPTIHYLSSNPEIASVDDNGMITAKAEGEVTFTAYVELAGKRYESQPVSLHVVDKSAVQNNRLDVVTVGQKELDVTPETISGMIAKPKETITIQAENPAAKLEVSYRGQTLQGTGTITQEFDFYKGENGLQVKVTAPNGSEKSYHLVLSGVAEKDLSDENYDKDSTTGWGAIKKNESVGGHALSLKTEGALKTFDKGIGIHANGHLIYDIAGKGYQNFTALVGVDGESQQNGDMKFRFVVDGKEVHATKVMQAGSEAEKVAIDVNNASKLEIFVDKISTDWDDHASIVDAKFTTGLTDYIAPTTPTPETPAESDKPAVPVDYNSKYQLTYDKPAATTYDGWEKQALPVGNGEMGAKVFGLVGAEKIQYNEKTLWSGGPRPDSTDYNGGNYKDRFKVMADIRKALEAGDVSTAKKLAERNLIGPSDARYGRYLSFGDIFLDFTNQSKDLSSVTDYHRGLDISTAITSTSYNQDGTNFTRETFSSFPDDVTVTHLTQKGDKKLDFTLGMDLTRDLIEGGKYKTEKSDFKDGTVTASTDGILLKGTVKDNGLNFASYLGLKTDGTVTLEGDKLKVTGASQATLYLSAKTDFAQNPKTNYRKQIDVEKAVKDTVTKAKAKDYQVLKDSHIKDYQALFNRVKLNLGGKTATGTTKDQLTGYQPEQGQSLEELFFQYGRYLLITSSRDKQDALPANLQGVWNGVDNPPWNADYHLNVNLQMNYWPVYSTNLAENAKPLINYIDDMRYFGRIAAKEYAGIESKDGQENGWLVHTQATPFGWTTPGWNYYWGWSPAANAWIMQNVYDHYKFTHDEEYLKDKIYPMLKETAKFWNSFLHYDKASDRWVSSPSYSPEHGTITIGNTFDQSLVWQLFHDYMEAANHLKVDQDFVKEVQAKFEKLKPLHINKAGQIKEWYEEDTPVFTGEGVQKGHRHASHLVGLFPGTLFSKDNPEYLEAARVSLNDRGDGGTGWSKANKINLWARLLDGNRAHRLLAEQLRSSTLENLWDTHAPFQIDGNFGATSGMTEMLLQSHTGYVAPLPALPDAWKDGEVSGLVARGNFETSMKWADKNLEKLSFTSNSGGDLVVDYPNIEHTLVKVNGQEVKPALVKGSRIQLVTQKGDVITFENFTGRVTTLTAERKDSVTAALNFNAVKGASHYIIERTASADEGQAPAVRRFVTNDTHFVDRTIDSAHTYSYKVQAILGTVETPVSDAAGIDVLSYVFDDRDERIKYGSAFGNWPDTSLYGGTEKFADITDSNVSEAAATATLSFTGVGIEVYGLKSERLGLAKVTIDGKPAADMDFYDKSSQKGVLIGRYAGLSDGPHTMTITVKKENNGRTNERSKISLDYFKVLQGQANAVEKIDDRDARIQYGSAFGDWADSELYGGTEKYADINNSQDLAKGATTATIPFTGTGIRVYGLKTAALGKALVTLDGKDMPALDFYTDGASKKGAFIGEFTGLSDGPHTLTLTVDPNSPQGKKKISLDSFEIIKAAAVALDSPSLGAITPTDQDLAVTLPSGAWDAVALSVPGVTDPLILTKQDEGHVLLGENQVLDVADNVVHVPLPEETNRSEGGVVMARSVLGKTITSPTVAVFAEKVTETKPSKPVDQPGQPTQPTTPVEQPADEGKKPTESTTPADDKQPTSPAETDKPAKLDKEGVIAQITTAAKAKEAELGDDSDAKKELAEGLEFTKGLIGAAPDQASIDGFVKGFLEALKELHAKTGETDKPATPSEPAKPGNDNNPGDTGSKPVDPGQPVNPSVPDQPVDQPATPSDPVKPGNDSNPGDTGSKPVEPSQPANPSVPDQPVDQPGTPSEPAKPGNDSNPGDTGSKPVEPSQPANPSVPDQPVDQPGTPSDPAKPGNDSNPGDTGSKPVDPGQPANPTDQPGTPSEPVKPADPSQPTAPINLKTLVDKATGLQVFGRPADLAEADHLIVQKVADQSLAGKSYDAYDVKLMDKDNHEVQPKGAVFVSLPVKAGAEVENVYYVTPSKELQPLKFEQKGDRVEFMTTHFSIYAVVYKQATPAATSTVTKTEAPVQTLSTKSAEMGKQAASQESMIALSHKEESKPDTGDKTMLPNTGDSSNAHLLFLASLSLALSSLFYLKARKD